MVLRSCLINFILKNKILTISIGFLFLYVSSYFLQAVKKLLGRDVNCDYMEPIDVVYTWVNGSDPKFLRDLQNYLTCNDSYQTDISLQRYDDKYELKFSLRALEKYAPWVRHVYIVTNGQIPYWLNLDYEKVSLISHNDIFLNKSNLPTFSSPAIESQIHRSHKLFLDLQLPIHTRFKEHVAHIRYNRKEKSSVASHVLENNHEVDLSCLNLIKAINNPLCLDAYESLEIFKNKEKLMNSDFGPIPYSDLFKLFSKTIPGLSNKFIYFNDDMFLGAPTYLEDFYSPSNGFFIYFAWPLPMCAEDCPWTYVGDKECDLACYNVECQMDGGDCDDGQEFNDLQGEYFSYDKGQHNNENDSVKKKGLLNQIENVHDFKYGLHNFSHVVNSVVNQNKSVKRTIESEFKRSFNGKNLTEFVESYNQKVIMSNKLRRKKRNIKELLALRDSFDKSHSNRLCKSTAKIDTYGASLQHTNRVYNSKYGFFTRQTPAHAPILIDKSIMEKMQQTFDKEFKKTAANRVRREDDMQFSFSYYYFLIHETHWHRVDEIFDMFDTDNSGTWSDREIRTILTRLYDLPLTYATVDHFENLILNCSRGYVVENLVTPEFERYIDSKLPTVSKNMVVKCETLSAVLKKRFGLVKKYKYKVIKNSQEKYVTFKMLTSNVSQVVGHLDEIRKNTKKFVCLNDNMDNSSNSENELVRAILYDFYLSLFPNPSRFELPNDLRNRFVDIHELRLWKSYHFKLRLFIYLCFSLLMYITYCNLCKRRIWYRCVNKVCC